jgi:aminoglycoside phosphotransferase (APT) family kinase protein
LAEKLVPYLESLYPERSNLSVTDLEEINMCWETELYTLEVNSTKNGDPIKEHRVLRVFQGDNAGRKSAKEYYLMRKLFDVGYPVPQVYGYDVSREAIGKPFILIERILVLVRTL